MQAIRRQLSEKALCKRRGVAWVYPGSSRRESEIIGLWLAEGSMSREPFTKAQRGPCYRGLSARHASMAMPSPVARLAPPWERRVRSGGALVKGVEADYLERRQALFEGGRCRLSGHSLEMAFRQTMGRLAQSAGRGRPCFRLRVAERGAAGMAWMAWMAWMGALRARVASAPASPRGPFALFDEASADGVC